MTHSFPTRRSSDPQIYRMYYPSLSYFSYNLTGDMSQAEDIASESLSKLWQRHSGFNTQASIKSFLYTTARNASLNYLKSLRVRTSVHEELLYLAEKKDDYILGNMIQAQLLKYIYDEIEVLPPRLKEIRSEEHKSELQELMRNS